MLVGHDKDHGPLQINLFGGEEAMEVYPGHLVTGDILSFFHIGWSNDFARLVQAHLIHPRPFRRGNQRDGEGQARANLLELSLKVRLVQGKTAVGRRPTSVGHPSKGGLEPGCTAEALTRSLHPLGPPLSSEESKGQFAGLLTVPECFLDLRP